MKHIFSSVNANVRRHTVLADYIEEKSPRDIGNRPFVKEYLESLIKTNKNFCGNNMSSEYLLHSFQTHSSIFILENINEKFVVHSVITFFFDKYRNLTVDAFCVNKVLALKGAGILLDILIEGCRHSKIRIIKLKAIDTIDTIGFYKHKKFEITSSDSIQSPIENGLIPMQRKITPNQPTPVLTPSTVLSESRSELGEIESVKSLKKSLDMNETEMQKFLDSIPEYEPVDFIFVGENKKEDKLIHYERTSKNERYELRKLIKWPKWTHDYDLTTTTASETPVIHKQTRKRKRSKLSKNKKTAAKSRKIRRQTKLKKSKKSKSKQN
jgi:hypothetical protein